MASKTISPTRMELTRLKARLKTARRGHKLLKDKRDELMRQFLDLARENRALRARVEEKLAGASKQLALARAVVSPQAVDAALLVPAQQVGVEVAKRNIMSVNVPQFSYRLRNQDKSALYAYGLAFTPSELDGAVERMAAALNDMLRLAEVEKSCQLLSGEIEKTRRRVNALEYVMIPQFEQTIRTITAKLDENERGAIVRLMKVKDMIAERT